MADNLVLASPLVDQDDNGNQVVVAEEGDTLPAKYKDNEDEYVAAGILVPESYHNLMNSDVLRRAAVHGLSLDDVRTLTKEDLENVQAVSDAAEGPTMTESQGTPAAGPAPAAEEEEAPKATPSAAKSSTK